MGVHPEPAINHSAFQCFNLIGWVRANLGCC